MIDTVSDGGYWIEYEISWTVSLSNMKQLKVVADEEHNLL